MDFYIEVGLIILFYLFIFALSITVTAYSFLWLARQIKRIFGEPAKKMYYGSLLPFYDDVLWLWSLPNKFLRLIGVYAVFRFIGLSFYHVVHDSLVYGADWVRFQMKRRTLAYRAEEFLKQEKERKRRQEEEKRQREAEEEKQREFRKQKDEEERKKREDERRKKDQERRREQERYHHQNRKKEDKKYKTPYAILGISENASLEEIKKAYKVKVQQYHPDKFSHLDDEDFKNLSEERFKEIQDAFEKLKKWHS